MSLSNTSYFFCPFLTFNDILSFKCISREYQKITKQNIEEYTIMEIKNPTISFSRTMINTILCDSCENYSISRENEKKFVTYCQDILPRRVIVICTNNWQCRFKAIISRASCSAKQKYFYTKYPLAESYQTFSIPRSNGTRNLATILNPNVVKYSSRIGLCAELGWDESREHSLSKHVKLTDIIVPSRKLYSIEIQVLNELSKIMNQDVVSYIKKFLSYPSTLKPKFLDWDLISGRVYNSDITPF